MQPLRIILIATGIFSLFFCGIYRHDVEPSKYYQLAAQPQFQPVGRVLRGGRLAGSCVLISPRYVLSAAHVFLEFGSGRRAIDAADSFQLEFGGRRYGAKRLKAYEEYLRQTSGEKRGDFILIELSESVKGIKPATLNTQTDELRAVAVGVGYGVSGPANNMDAIVPTKQKTAGENTIDTLDGYLRNGVPTLLTSDFDDPQNGRRNKMGSPVPLPLEYQCGGGDSGGGLFRKDSSGRWLLLGICSDNGMDMSSINEHTMYGSTTSWTRIAAFTDWIEANME